jgi:multi-sensor hybrid histidine kinase (EC 2.7.13.3)
LRAIFEFEYRVQHKDGSWRWIVSRDTVFMKTASGQLKQILGTGTDITERKHTEDEIKLLLAATQAISQSADFDRALANILRLLCNAIGWKFAEAWIPAEDGTVLEYSPSWYASDQNLEAFGHESNQFVFARGVGVPGRIWLTQQMEWREDISNCVNSVFSRSQLAAKSGLKACFGIPIRAEGEVLAVLVFYQRRPSTLEGARNFPESVIL